jgi:hypothetical protein
LAPLVTTPPKNAIKKNRAKTSREGEKTEERKPHLFVMIADISPLNFSSVFWNSPRYETPKNAIKKSREKINKYKCSK